MTQPVTEVTRNAAQDEFTADDYREMYEELRGYDADSGKYNIALRPFAEMIQSEFSHGQWSKYHTGKAELNRTQRNELRQAVGRPPLPLTISEVAETVDPDAAVFLVGTGVPDRLILIGETVETATIHVNGDVTAEDAAPKRHETLVAAPPRGKRVRKQVQVHPDTFSRLQAHRDAGGYSSIAAAIVALLESANEF